MSTLTVPGILRRSHVETNHTKKGGCGTPLGNTQQPTTCIVTYQVEWGESCGQVKRAAVLSPKTIIAMPACWWFGGTKERRTRSVSYRTGSKTDGKSEGACDTDTRLRTQHTTTNNMHCDLPSRVGSILWAGKEGRRAITQDDRCYACLLVIWWDEGEAQFGIVQ